MPILTAVALAATPLLAFLGSVIGHRVSRVGAVELDRWRRREETMRMLRWASELAVETEVERSGLGLTVLQGLLVSSLLDADDQALVLTVAEAVRRGP